DHQPLGENDYQALSEQEQNEIEEKSYKVQEKIMEYSDIFRRFDKQLKTELENLDKDIALTVVNKYLADLEAAYESYSEIVDYLQEVKKDIVKHIQDFLPHEEQEQENSFQAMLSQRKGKSFTTKYKINVMVDHRETIGAPVITADNPTYYNLLGK